MQENNVDIKGIIGFILIRVLLMFWVWRNPPEQAEIVEQENQQTEIEVNSKEKEKVVHNWSNENIRVEKGKWGKFYLIKGKIRKEISKSIDVNALTLDDAKQMLDNKKE